MLYALQELPSARYFLMISVAIALRRGMLTD
jgi:hypothetical protein